MNDVTHTLEKWKDDFYALSEYIGSHPSSGMKNIKLQLL